MDLAFTELASGYSARQTPGARPAASNAVALPSDDAEAKDAADIAAKGDSILLSEAAQSVLNSDGAALGGDEGAAGDEAGRPPPPPGQGPPPPGAGNGPPPPRPDESESDSDTELTEEEEREVEDLKARDQEVKTHEQAHQAAGGSHAGSPSYEYTSGPDGKQYATSGEVQIDTAAVPNNPTATIAKMEQVKRAALAPAEPSGADRAVAAKAEQAKLKAQRELAEQAAEESGTEPAGNAAQPVDPLKAATSLDPAERRAQAANEAETRANDTEQALIQSNSQRGGLVSLLA